MDAQAHFQQGCSLFVDEDYDSALAAFNKAIEANNTNEEYYVKRSACLHKLRKFTEALADANSAIKINPNSAKAYMRKGLACFSLEEFETAKAAFNKGKSLDSQDNSFQLWLRKCDAELEEQENDISAEAPSPSADKEPEVAPTPTPKAEVATPAPITTTTTTTTTPAPTPAPVPVEQASPPPAEEKKPAVRHSWYQTDAFVCVTFFIKDRTEKDLNVEFGNKTLDVDIRLPDGGNYIFDIELCNEIIPSECKKIINKPNVEIKMKKAKPLNWSTLEYTGATTVNSAINTVSSDNIKHVYPSSSKKKKNWDLLAAEVEEEKLEGEQALNKVFQDIFGKGTDEQRKAMMKSFVESGGTVLSTNWDEVSKGEVKGSPPKGMEAKKWNE